ncbi:MAG TPA: dipeptide epimerase [Fastidiosipila sp.]|nr:dipeptide epimerase [Fastidiosipila sp.]
MKITEFSFEAKKTVMNVEFRIALADGNCSLDDTVLIKLHTDAGLIGYGEAQPFRAVTGETIQSVKGFYEVLAPLLIGRSPFELETIHRLMNDVAFGNNAAKAGIDIALYDLCAKAVGLPLYRYLGGSEGTVYTDMTIGINKPKKMAELAKAYVDDGFTMLKVKVGLNDEEDIEAIRLIREAVGPDIELRLDANQGWQVKQTLAVLKAMEPYNIREIEQPVQYHDIAGLRAVRVATDIDVVADESILLPADALRVLKEDACDIVNIKLMKSGGIYQALKINDIAEAAGIPCMVGCMGETALGIAAGAALAAARDNIAYADLDSHNLNDPLPGMQVMFEQKGSAIKLAEVAGLGVSFD